MYMRRRGFWTLLSRPFFLAMLWAKFGCPHFTRFSLKPMKNLARRLRSVKPHRPTSRMDPDSEIVMVDGTFWDASVEQDRSWDHSGTTISGIQGTHQNSIRVRMLVLRMVSRVNSRLSQFR